MWGNQILKFEEMNWILFLFIGSYIMVNFNSKENNRT